MTSTTDVFAKCMDRLLNKDIDGFLALMAPECVMEFPFAPPGHDRLLSTPDELHAHFHGSAGRIDIKNVIRLEIHETADPETIIVEFAGDGVALATGQPCEVAFIAVFTARDGLCVRYRDYWNPLTTLAMHGNDPA